MPPAFLTNVACFVCMSIVSFSRAGSISTLPLEKATNVSLCLARMSLMAFGLSPYSGNEVGAELDAFEATGGDLLDRLEVFAAPGDRVIAELDGEWTLRLDQRV